MVLDRKNVFLLFALLESFRAGTAWTLQTYGIQDLCGTAIELNTGLRASIILKSKEHGAYREDVQGCDLVLKRFFSNHKLVVSFRTRDLRPDGQDVLMIDYQNGVQRTYTSDNNTDDPEESEWEMTSRDVLITFNTASGGPSTSNYKGFQMTVTLYVVPPCEADHFRCNSGNLCIADKLKCDGHNHCGDRSDQWYCFDDNNTSAIDSTTSSIDINTGTVDSTTSSTGGTTPTNHDSFDTGLKIGYGFAIVAGILIVCFFIWFTFWYKCKGCCKWNGTCDDRSDRVTHAVTSYPSSGSSSYFGRGASSSSHVGSSAAGGYFSSSVTYAGSSAAGCS